MTPSFHLEALLWSQQDWETWWQKIGDDRTGASMGPTTDINQACEALISRVDEQLAHVNEQIKSADEQLARLSSRKHEAPRGYPPGRPRVRPWLRGIVGLLIAAYIVAAAFVSQSSYGNAVAQSAPLLTSALALPLETLGLLMQPNPPSVQLAATAGASAPAQIAPNDVAHTALPVSPETAELIQTLARDLANVEREIEQLKASQQQLASDNAKAIEQIKVSQEQEARDIAKTVELLKASQDQVAQLIARVSGPNLKPKRPVSQPQVAIGMRQPASTPAARQTSAHP
jgi:hypothetical protein